MPRYFVENKGKWNIFSTIVDDFLFDEFVCITALKVRLLYEEHKRIEEDINSLLTDRPKVNVMSYEEAMELIRKDEPSNSKIEQVKQRSCDTCKGRDIEGWRNPCIGCTEFAFYEPKDGLQTKVWDKAQSDCDLWQKDRTCIGCYRYDICREADCKDKSQTCDTCRNHAEMCLVSECHYEPEILIPPHHTGFVLPIKQTERSE